MKTPYNLVLALSLSLSAHLLSDDFVYIVNGPGTVTVIDATSYAEIPGSPFASIASPPAVSAQVTISMSPDGQRTYVPGFQAADTVAVFNIDPVTGGLSHIATSPVGGFTAPFSAAIHPDNSFVYVTNLGGNAVAICDVDLNILTTVNTDGNPARVIVDSSGTYAYIACPGSGTVMRFDISSTAPYLINPISASIAPGTTPYTVALNPEETYVYVTSMGFTATINRLDLDLTNLQQASYGLQSVGLAFSSDPSRLFLASLNDNVVYVLDPITLAPAASAINTGLSPYVVAVNPLETLLFVSNAGAGTVSVFDLTQAGYPQIAQSPLAFSGLQTPYGIGFTPHAQIQPPTSFRGKQKRNDFGFQYELYNHLQWNPPSEGAVVAYVLYRNGAQLARLASSTQYYDDHSIKKNTSTSYAITTIDDSGNESEPATLVVSGG